MPRRDSDSERSSSSEDVKRDTPSEDSSSDDDIPLPPPPEELASLDSNQHLSNITRRRTSGSEDSNRASSSESEKEFAHDIRKDSTGSNNELKDLKNLLAATGSSISLPEESDSEQQEELPKKERRIIQDESEDDDDDVKKKSSSEEEDEEDKEEEKSERSSSSEEETKNLRKDSDSESEEKHQKPKKRQSKKLQPEEDDNIPATQIVLPPYASESQRKKLRIAFAFVSIILVLGAVALIGIGSVGKKEGEELNARELAQIIVGIVILILPSILLSISTLLVHPSSYLLCISSIIISVFDLFIHGAIVVILLSSENCYEDTVPSLYEFLSLIECEDISFTIAGAVLAFVTQVCLIILAGLELKRISSVPNIDTESIEKSIELYKTTSSNSAKNSQSV